MEQYHIPEIDLVIVDLYPFEETVASTTDDQAIIEKIDVGGPSMIRAAAKNHKDVVVIASRMEYALLGRAPGRAKRGDQPEQRRSLAARAFEVCAHYDVVIARYFTGGGAAGSSDGREIFPGIRSNPNPCVMERSSPVGQVLRKIGRALRATERQGTIL